MGSIARRQKCSSPPSRRRPCPNTAHTTTLRSPTRWVLGQMSCLASTHAPRTRPPTSTELLSRATLSRHQECRSDSLLLCLRASYLILPILLGCEGASVLCWVLHSRPNCVRKCYL